MSFNDVYYHQSGRGGRGVHEVFVGSPYQRGHGLGSFFVGLFRRALPFLAKGARAVGKEAVRAGVNIIDDITENNMSFKDSLKNRMTESGRTLKRKASEKLNKLMEGSGYIPIPRKRALQYGRVAGGRKIIGKATRRRSRVLKRKLVGKKRTIRKKRRVKFATKLRKLSKKGRKSKIRKTKRRRKRRKKSKFTDIFE